MVRHILRKDWRLLWPLVAALAAVQAFIASARFRAGHFPTFPSVPASLLVLLAAALVATFVVLQDPIPGASQDWLVRPVSRRDLFLAKLLFVLAFVQGPWFVADLLQGVANGFSFGQSAAAAIYCAVRISLTMTLVVLAFAALTASMTETLLAAVGVLAILIAFLIFPAMAGINNPTALTGFAWVPSLVRAALLLVAVGGVLVLQYGWRRTWAARVLFAVALLAGQSVSFLPWGTTFRLGALLAGGSAGGAGVAVAFAPGEGRFRPAAGQRVDDIVEKPGFGPEDVAAENQRRRAEGARSVFVPVQVSGLGPDWRLLADRSEVKLIGRDGRFIYQGIGNALELRATGPVATVHQGIRVPGAVYRRVNAEEVDIQLDYWFTLFLPDGKYSLPATGGDQRMPGIGWCATKVDDSGTRILFECLQPGERPPCLAVVVEHMPTRQHNPEVSLCAPDYSPYPGHVIPDAISRFGGRLPFYDPSGSIHYPVGGPELPESRVVVTNFRPKEHFVRRVVISAVRLQDWGAEAP